MKEIHFGVFFLCYGIFLLFFSAKEKKNMLGYKSLQQNMHKDIWMWTNQSFGLLTIFGGIGYLVIFIVLNILNISLAADIYKLALIYIMVSAVITECYGLYKRYTENVDTTSIDKIL